MSILNEGLGYPDASENYAIVKREIKENGIRVVSVENLQCIDSEFDHGLIVLEETGQELSLSSCMELLVDSMMDFNGTDLELVKSAVRQLGECLSSEYRGICVVDSPSLPLLDDGVVYLSKGALFSNDRSQIENEANSVFLQLNNYTD